MYSNLFFRIILLISCLLFSSFCSKDEKAIEAQPIPKKVAKVISVLPSGSIAPHDSIEIAFVSYRFPSNLVDSTMESAPIEIKPAIDFSCKYKNTYTISCFPKEKWKSRTNYFASLNLVHLDTNFKNDSLDLVNMSFYIDGQEITKFDSDFKSANKSNGKDFILEGTIQFKYSVSQALLEKHIKLLTPSGEAPLTFTPYVGRAGFQFTSSIIERTKNDQNYSLIVPEDIFDLEEEYTRTITLPSMSHQKVVTIKKITSGSKPKIQIQFSDKLHPKQNLEGLISVSPSVDISITKQTNSVLIEGDFAYGNNYEVTIDKVVKSRWETILAKSHTEMVAFNDLPPQVQFASKGVIMPTSNNSTLQFSTCNLKRVHIEIKEVFDKNINSLLHREQTVSGKNRTSSFKDNYSGKTGVIVLSKTLEIGTTKNKWLLSEINLSKLIGKPNGLYLIRINFNPQDMLIEVPDFVEQGDDDKSYFSMHSEIYKPIIQSNLGIIAKKSQEKYYVYVIDLITMKPISDATVTLQRSYYSNNSTKSQTTGSDGLAIINQSYGSLITAEKNGQISYLRLGSMEWNTTGYDVSGVSSNLSGIRNFIYTDRGVYRPGDSVHVSVIFRNSYNSFGHHAITAILYDPSGREVTRQSQKHGSEGFYSFSFATKQSDKTGNWRVSFSGGNAHAQKTIKVETVVPYKLKVRLDDVPSKIKWNDKKVEYSIHTKYLFGTPAKGLDTKTEIEIVSSRARFPKYESFTFERSDLSFKGIKEEITSGTLDSEGKKGVTWTIPKLDNVSSKLLLKIHTKVFEKGGRPNDNWEMIPMSPYRYYVGIEKNSHRYYSTKPGVESKIPVVVVDNSGKAVAHKKIMYKIYHCDRYWWYHYDNRDDFEQRFKSDKTTTLVTEGDIISGSKATVLPFTPPENGQYLIEVTEEESGHTSSKFVGAYRYGAPTSDLETGTLMIKSNKKKYKTGDKATITFPVPPKGVVLLTVEQDNTILHKKLLPVNQQVIDGKKGGMTYSFNVTEEMAPNAYVSIAVIQPHSQTKNDRPMRMFGILPIQVENPQSRHALTVDMPDVLEPNKEFTITVDNSMNALSHFTVAVVDEGLLDITNFKTPNAWKAFFKKIRLDVETYDLFSHIIGANKEDVFKRFSTGGDLDYMKRKKRLSPGKKSKRFKPVSLFSGIVETNAHGKGTVTFTMPEYVGSVRVMVLSVRGHNYAHTDKTVLVKTDVIIQPSLPRVLGPKETFTVPVNLFALEKNIGKSTLSITTGKGISIEGPTSIPLTFTTESDTLINFTLKTGEIITASNVSFKVTTPSKTITNKTDIDIRPSAPRTYNKRKESIRPGDTLTFSVPMEGSEGTNNAAVAIQSFFPINFSSRIDHLIRYPYGCIEQTTSSVFPQLYLKDFLGIRYTRDIDKNINAGIERLARFQTSSGGLAYWPGNTDPSEWGSIYAAHFLTEAKAKGYHVPDQLYTSLLTYLSKQYRNTNNRRRYISNTYQAYVLARAGKKPMDKLNLLYQSKMKELSVTDKYLLAAAYYIVGQKETALTIVNQLETTVADYNEFSGSYGSSIRDMALILGALVDMEDERAEESAEYLSKMYAERKWHSTQTSAQTLLALGRYLKYQYKGVDTQNLFFKGALLFPDGTQKEFTQHNYFSTDLSKYVGKELSIVLDSSTTYKKTNVTITSDGVPPIDTRKSFSKNLILSVEWLDENGDKVDPTALVQGTTFYGHIAVSNTAQHLPRIDEVALVQIIPSGWEIENTRLSGALKPEWAKKYTLGHEEYVDIRDDRMMWFFDMRRHMSYDFLVKLNTVSLGTFHLPPTTVEAMYDYSYSALHAGHQVSVVRKK